MPYTRGVVVKRAQRDEKKGRGAMENAQSKLELVQLHKNLKHGLQDKNAQLGIKSVAI